MVFCSQNTTTRKQTSPHTKDFAQSQTLFHATAGLQLSAKVTVNNFLAQNQACDLLELACSRLIRERGTALKFKS
jgi:hypothetical protein